MLLPTGPPTTVSSRADLGSSTFRPRALPSAYETFALLAHSLGLVMTKSSSTRCDSWRTMRAEPAKADTKGEK